MANGSNLGINVTCVIEDSATIEKKLKQVLQNVHASIKIDDIDIDKQALESKIQGMIKSISGLSSELKQSFSGIPLTELQQALNMVNQIQQKQINKVSITTDKSGNTTKTVTESTDEYGRQVKVVETLNEKLETTTTNYQKQRQEAEKLANTIANGREKAELKNKEVDKTNEINQANAINKALEEQYNENLKLAEAIGKVNEQSQLKAKSQESKSDLAQIQAQNKAIEEQALLKQKIKESMPSVNEKLNSLQSNGILNQSDLSDVTSKASNIKTAQDLEEVNRQLTALKAKESNILSVSKALEKLSSDADLLKNKYRGLVPDGEFTKFKAEINSTTAELKKMEGTNFNGLKNQVNELRKTFDSLQNTAKSNGVQLANQDSKGLLSYLTGSMLKFSAWLGIGNVVMGMVNGFKEGVGYTLQMDQSLTNIEMITGRTKDNVTELMNGYKQLAGEMHTTNTEMTSAAEEYLRAGYDDQTTQSMLKANMIGSKISGQSNQDVSQQLIAIKNGFGMTKDEIMGVVDTLSTLDNASSTSFADLAKAMQYVSFTAKGVGVDFTELSSYIAIVSDKTRMSAETIGNAFKTIFTRYQDVKIGKTEDENGEAISLSNTETALNKVGIALRTNKDTFRDFGDVLNDLKVKWKDLSQVDQAQILKVTKPRM